MVLFLTLGTALCLPKWESGQILGHVKVCADLQNDFHFVHLGTRYENEVIVKYHCKQSALFLLQRKVSPKTQMFDPKATPLTSGQQEVFLHLSVIFCSKHVFSNSPWIELKKDSTWVRRWRRTVLGVQGKDCLDTMAFFLAATINMQINTVRWSLMASLCVETSVND